MNKARRRIIKQLRRQALRQQKGRDREQNIKNNKEYKQN